MRVFSLLNDVFMTEIQAGYYPFSNPRTQLYYVELLVKPVHCSENLTSQSGLS